MEMSYCQNIFVKSDSKFGTFILFFLSLEDIQKVIAFRCCNSIFLF